MEHVPDLLSVRSASSKSRSDIPKRRALFEEQERTRQESGWMTALLEAGFSKKAAKRIAQGAIYGAAITLLVRGLMSS